MGKIEIIVREVLSLIRAIILQDLFLAYRQTKKVPRYTIVKLLEELFITFIITLIITVSYHNTSTSPLLFLLTFSMIHMVYALFSPPLYNSIGIKNKLRPISREKALALLSMMLSKVNKYVKEVYMTGSICYAQEVRDVDMTLVPKSYLSTYVLFLYLRLWILIFIIRRMPFFPDVYIHDVNPYTYTCKFELT